jgi:hypothetical protein
MAGFGAAVIDSDDQDVSIVAAACVGIDVRFAALFCLAAARRLSAYARHWFVGGDYAASFGMALSTNRKNRVLRARARETCLQLLRRSIRLLRCGLRLAYALLGRFLPRLKAASGRPPFWAMAPSGFAQRRRGRQVAFPSGFCPTWHKLVSRRPVGLNNPFARSASARHSCHSCPR